MPGSIIFKPIEASLTHNTDWVTKMNPYCVFIVEDKRFNSSTCKHGGKNPHWNDVVIVPMPEKETKIKVEIMDKDRFTKDDQIGSFTVDLSELQDLGQSGKRFDLLYKEKKAGELLLEVSFRDEDPNVVHSELIQKEEAPIQEPTVFKKQEEETPIEEKPKPVEEEPVKIQEVDVVEMRPVEQTVEVMEAHKVIKDVEYTEIVPVKKMIETVEHQVVKKEVEIMEPQVVTKTIQVVQNVLVKKEIEILEAVPVLKEVEILEPQTFTKQVEVTEHVPVMKTVTVTEPVHVKKSVELGESVITTQSITHPDVVVVVNEEEELSKKLNQISLSEEEKARYLAMSEEEKGKLDEEEKLRWNEARRLAAGGDDKAE